LTRSKSVGSKTAAKTNNTEDIDFDPIKGTYIVHES
jgi:hypothetical protein